MEQPKNNEKEPIEIQIQRGQEILRLKSLTLNRTIPQQHKEEWAEMCNNLYKAKEHHARNTISQLSKFWKSTMQMKDELFIKKPLFHKLSLKEKFKYKVG